MMWVDHPSYFGPDRRRKASGLRLRERRRANCAGAPPPLRGAITQLRLRALEAHGASIDPFIARAHNTALLAEMQGERQTARELASLSARLMRNRDADMRATIYQSLDRAHALLKVH